MPQLDFSTFSSQIFWLTVSFTLLYFIMSRFCLPVIREVIENRQSRISGDLDKAELFKDQTREVEESYNSSLNSAREGAAAAVASAREKSKQEEAKRHAKLNENFAKQQKEADERISKLSDEARDVLKPTLTEAVVTIMDEIVGIKTSKKDAEKAVSELL